MLTHEYNGQNESFKDKLENRTSSHRILKAMMSKDESKKEKQLSN